jgi:molybdate transport system substrate-binding protein
MTPTRRSACGIAAAVTLGLFAPVATALQPSEITVAAASDLQFALEELAQAFRKEGGPDLRLVFGSSGQFAAQLLQGAPFHLFLSADEALALRVADAGLTRDRGRLYALGRIALVVPHGSLLKADAQLRDLAAALRDGRLRRFAIANPQHAPYGARARQALEHAGLWQAMQPFLVFGENVSQAAQFALSGAAQGGIVAWSLARAPALSGRSAYALIDESWHQPLRQRMVLMKNAPAAARAFYDFIAGARAQEMLVRHGFARPTE